MSVENALRELEGAGTSLRCRDLQRILESLRFEVRNGKKPGHKIVHHPELPEFYGSSYTCGHGRNPQVKPNYIRTMLKMIRHHEAALRDLLEEENEK